MLYCYITVIQIKFLAARIRLCILSEKRLHLALHRFPDLIINTVTDRFSFDRSFYDSGIFHFFQMLGNGGLRQTKFFHQIIADTRFLTDDVLKNRNSCRMRQYFEQRCEPVLFIAENFRFCETHHCVLVLQYYDIKF